MSDSKTQKEYDRLFEEQRHLNSNSHVHDFLDLDRYDRLTPKQQIVARFVAENPSFVAFATASEVAMRAGTSTATVVRFAQALNFAGYEELQQNIRHYYLKRLAPVAVIQSRSQADQNIFAAQIYQDLQNLRSTLDTLHPELLEQVAQQIQAAGQIVILSTGTYSAVGAVLGHLLRFMGYPAYTEFRGTSHVAAAIAPLGPKDVLIGISFWRVIREVTDAVVWATKRGVQTVAITDSVYSPIARAAKQAIIVPTEGVSFFQSMVAALSVSYAILAYIAHTADPSKKMIMEAAQEAWEVLDLFY